MCHCKDGYKKLQGDDFTKGSEKRVVCVPVTKGECKNDYVCKATEICNDGSCVDGCKNVVCTANAYCFVNNHDAWCTCNDGYEMVRINGAAQCIPEKPKTTTPKTTSTTSGLSTTTTTATGKLDARLNQQFAHEGYVYITDITIRVKYVS
jgi:hypothetical protein